MAKRKKTKKNRYPDFSGKKREIHNVLRDSLGRIIRPIFIDSDKNKPVERYELLDILDIEDVLPNDFGRRSLNLKKLNSLNVTIIDSDFNGELYKYCIHDLEQNLEPISNFTFNETTHITKLKGINRCLQPYNKNSKKIYVNTGEAGNSTRTKEQLVEGSQGARMRDQLIRFCLGKTKVSLDFIYNKFDGKCFNCNSFIEYKDTHKKGLDHTLPLSKWFPLNNQTSTFLCKDCNSSKRDQWPGDFYDLKKLETLSTLTDLPIDLLNSNQHYNKEVVNIFVNDFDNIMEKWSTFGRRDDISKKNKFILFLEKEVNNISKYMNDDENLSILYYKMSSYLNEIKKRVN